MPDESGSYDLLWCEDIPPMEGRICNESIASDNLGCTCMESPPKISCWLVLSDGSRSSASPEVMDDTSSSNTIGILITPRVRSESESTLFEGRLSGEGGVIGVIDVAAAGVSFDSGEDPFGRDDLDDDLGGDDSACDVSVDSFGGVDSGDGFEGVESGDEIGGFDCGKPWVEILGGDTAGDEPGDDFVGDSESVSGDGVFVSSKSSYSSTLFSS